MSTVLENIDTIKQQATVDYAELTEAFADGETPDNTREILFAADKSYDDLKADAQRLVDRRTAFEKLTTADGMAAEIVAAEAEFKAAVKKNQELYNQQLEELKVSSNRVGELRKKHDALLVRQRELRKAARQTLQATIDPEIEKCIAPLRKRRTELLHSLEVVYPHRNPAIIEIEIEKAREKFRDLRDQNAEIEMHNCQQRISRLKEELKKSQERAEICKPIKAELAQVENEIAALELSKMQP